MVLHHQCWDRTRDRNLEAPTASSWLVLPGCTRVSAEPTAPPGLQDCSQPSQPRTRLQGLLCEPEQLDSQGRLGAVLAPVPPAQAKGTILVSGLCKYTAGERCVAGLRVNPSAPHSQNCCPSSAAAFCCLWPPLSLPRPSCAPWSTFVLRVTSLHVRVSCARRFPDFAHEGSARTPLCAPERLKGQSPCVGDTARLAALNPGTEHTSHAVGHSARSCTHTEPTPPAWKKSAFCWLEASLDCGVSFFQPPFFSFS